MIFEEGNLIFDFSQALAGKKFDDDKHGLSHCMKAVDFVIEVEDKVLFIEVKNPQHPKIPPYRRKKTIQLFEQKLKSKELIDKELVPKFRDSYLYEYALGNINKPAHYLVLIALETLTEAELDNQTQYLHNQLPVDPPHLPWKIKFVHGCIIFTLNTWNRYLPQFPIKLAK